MWRNVPFARQRRPIVGVLRMCWLLPGSFDCCCCPHTSVHRPSVACLAVFLCGPGALFLHALSGPHPYRGHYVGMLWLGFTFTGHRVRVYKSDGFLAEGDPQQPPMGIEWWGPCTPNWRLQGIAFYDKSFTSLRANPYIRRGGAAAQAKYPPRAPPSLPTAHCQTPLTRSHLLSTAA